MSLLAPVAVAAGSKAPGDRPLPFVPSRFGRQVELIAARAGDAGFCPLFVARDCPERVCDGSLGRRQQVRAMARERRVSVRLTEPLGRAGKRCIVELHVKQLLPG